MGNKLTISLFAGITLVAILTTYFVFFKQEAKLPIYQPIDINPALVDSNLLKIQNHPNDLKD